MKSFNQKNIHCAKAYKRGPQKASRNFAFNAAAIAASICFAWQASFASDNVNDDSAKKTTIQDNLNYSISDHFSVVSGGNNSADDNYGLYIVNSTITFSTTPDQMNSGKMLMTAFNSKSGSFNEMKISNSTLTSNQPQNTNSIIVVFGTGQKFTSNKLWIDNNSSVSNVNEIYAVHGVTHAGAQINDNHIYIGSASDSQRTNLVRDTQIIGSWASIPYGEIKNNSVEIVNAQIGGDDETLITAAYAAETGINVDIQNNMVSVSNSDLRNDFIVAAYVSGSASANNNTVTIGTGVTTGTGILTLNALFGGFAPGSEYARFFSGNTLNVASPLRTNILRGFPNYNFTFNDKTAVIGQPVIAVTGDNKVLLVNHENGKAGSNITISGSSFLKAGEKYTLISSAKGFVDENGTQWSSGEVKDLLTDLVAQTNYSAVRVQTTRIAADQFTMDIESDGSTGQNLSITLKGSSTTDPTGPTTPTDPDQPTNHEKPGDHENPPVTVDTASPGAQSLMQSSLSGYNTLFAASDLFVDTLMHSREARRTGLFAAARGGRYNVKTSTRFETNITSALLGVSGEIGGAEIGGFVEMGNASYETRTPFEGANVRTSGRNNYAGAGLYGIQPLGDTGLKLTGYVKGGWLRNDYDALLGASTENLDQTSAYWGAHLGLSFDFAVTEKLSTRLFLNYFYDAHEGEAYRLSSGERVHYDALNGQRIQLGSRLEYGYTGNLRPFVSAAVEETLAAQAGGHATDSKGTLNLAEDDIEGTTGVLSLGWTYVNDARSFELGVTLNGYAGARNGVNGELSGVWKF